MQRIEIPLLFVGGGNMAHAIIHGAQKQGALGSGMVGVIEPDADRRGKFALGFEGTEEAFEWLGGYGSEVGIVLAVKPQMLGVATEGMKRMIVELGAGVGKGPVVISVLAGTRSERVEGMMGERCRVVRVMPNTPAAIGKGMSAVSGSGSSGEADVELAERLMGAVGDVVRIDESMMDAFTAVAGSGPAYVFYLVEAMTRAAVSLGFDAGTARRIVEGTVVGSGLLLEDSEDDAAGLRAKVTSKNGTTHAATTTLDGLGVMDAFVSALTAARDRGEELAEEGSGG